ncbi:TolC family protein [Antarcticibacterium flavum]|uniref:TolC family protein n=1 Tax=Antarcticibacterium flavum TaxID=2058175 RepID=A0A5B7X7H1_9FLAO|nr:TolC family protein [Antarcticibacterium flavum]QCY71075.1 TolC family protein [Antarcticibacterium flavum]
MLRTLLCIIFLLGAGSSFCQTDTLRLNLDECIKIALENNLELRRADLRAETSERNLSNSRANLLPSLNARINGGVNNGRSIDPFTNTYIEEQLSFSNVGLSLGATVFNGLRLRNSILRDRYNLQASEMEVEEARQNLILDVTLAYLQALNNRDLVRLAEVRLETTSRQLDRLQDLYEEGSGNPAAYTDILGQIANDRTAVVRAGNALTNAILTLSQLLNVEQPVVPETLAREEIIVDYTFSPEEVYEQALEGFPSIKARELRIEAAKKNINVARAFYFPEISFFAQLNTNFSSAARFFTETGTRVTETGGFVNLGDGTLPVFTNETIFERQEIGVYDQFSNNLNSVVGVAVDIPLFNGFRARNNTALQKIVLEESKVELENTRLIFRQSIQQAHADMQAAYREFHILQEQLEAYRESFRINEIRFNSGVSNIVEFIISKNNLDMAEINLANAKYEYLLRVQVLDYFRGKD